MLASDGVWEYMEPKDIIEKAQSFLPTSNVESCCKKIVSDAADCWAKVG
jgi:serine/threonine protein phosphatase PrpC